MKPFRNSICWYCDNACGNCEWSLFEKPIKKWIAYKTKIYNGKYGALDSYAVRYCPKYQGKIKGVLLTFEEVLAITKTTYLGRTKIETLNSRTEYQLYEVFIGSERLISMKMGDFKKWETKNLENLQ